MKFVASLQIFMTLIIFNLFFSRKLKKNRTSNLRECTHSNDCLSINLHCLRGRCTYKYPTPIKIAEKSG